MKKDRPCHGITLYDLATGVAESYLPRVPIGEERCPDGYGWIAGKHWGVIENGQCCPYRTFDVTISGNRIEGIPDGTKVLCQNRHVPVTDGVATFRVTYAADVDVLLHHRAYDDVTVKVPCEPGVEGAFEVRQDWARLRRLAYPPIVDLADAMAKGDKAAEQEYFAKCRAVKERYPKPKG